MSTKVFGFSELQNAYKLALENAEQLCKDATILCENGSYPHAYALYQLSREESGKCILLQHAILYNALGIQIDNEWLRKMGFTDHVPKTRNSLGLENVFISFIEQQQKVDFTLLHKDVEKTALNIKQTDNMKNASLYVGFNGNKFISPSQAISKDMAYDIAITAQACVCSARAIRWTEDGLTKMIDYLKQSEDKEKFDMIDCLKEMLYAKFKKEEADEYCKQIDSALESKQ